MDNYGFFILTFRIAYTLDESSECTSNNEILDKMTESNGTYAIGLSDLSLNYFAGKER